MNHSPSKYACPQDNRPVERERAGFRVVGTDTVYPDENGVPNFLRFPPVENADDIERLDRLNALADGGNWLSALQATHRDSQFVRYVTAVDRASFLKLLPIRSDSEILEIGPGLGQFTPLMARQARSVHALEVVPGQARFVMTRCRQEGLQNVEVAMGGDDCRLPYKDNSFDLVVLNLVFEWCASRLDGELHETAQTRLLSEMARVLRPGGTLYLATKNRYALRLLLGGADEHQFNLRFGSALPRVIAAWRLRQNGHGRAMGMLHSHNALKRMLVRAGFSRNESFWAAPEMRYPTHYIATDARAVRAARASPDIVLSEGRIKKRLMKLLPAAWVRHVTPGLAFVAVKDAAA